MNTSVLAQEVSADIDALTLALRDLADIEVVLIGGGDMPSNGY
jgi:hypothetical protein